jgi:YrbI family 3-deoxy-D-manno-octulosonate 8-phosphate phosphatase
MREREPKKTDSVLAIIPARGGSKGIPRKNVVELAGRPLVAHTIATARAAASVDRVVVSTDDDEITPVSRRFGAEVVRRPADISGDEASSEQALLHVLDHLEREEGYEADLVVFLQCTAPLTAPEDVDGTVRALVDAGADSALAVTPFHYFVWRRGEDGGAVGINHDPRERLLRQQREPEYRETGAVYVMRAAGFRKANHRFFGRTVMYVMPGERCLEIDEPADLVVAEVRLRRQARAAALARLPDPVAALVLDFDGVLTDNRVLVFQDGREAVVCHRGDGLGLERLRETGVALLVLSKEANPVVGERCRKLGIECLQGIADKEALLRQVLDERGIDMGQAVFVGNDVTDLGCMRAVSCGAAPADAHPAVLAVADLVLTRSGGFGAVRELCDLILRQRQGDDDGC